MSRSFCLQMKTLDKSKRHTQNDAKLFSRRLDMRLIKAFAILIVAVLLWPITLIMIIFGIIAGLMKLGRRNDFEP